MARTVCPACGFIFWAERKGNKSKVVSLNNTWARLDQCQPYRFGVRYVVEATVTGVYPNEAYTSIMLVDANNEARYLRLYPAQYEHWKFQLTKGLAVAIQVNPPKPPTKFVTLARGGMIERLGQQRP